MTVFDIYKGEHVEKGYMSIAITIYLNSNDHTLKEEDITLTDKKIRDIISSKFMGVIRQ